MTRDEFKKLKKGDVVQYGGMAPLFIISVDKEYDYSTKPPTQHTYEIFAHTGQSLKLSDPVEWIRDTSLLEDYKGNCPVCGKFDLVWLQDDYHCVVCGYRIQGRPTEFF